MDRRRFLQASLLAGVAPFASGALAESDAYFTDYRKALGRHEWLSAYQGLDSDLAAGPLQVEGKIPEALRGTLYRNGPALFERAGVRYHHLFDGDGMVQAFRFTDRGLTHRGRFVRTRKFVAESERGRFVFPGFGTAGQAESMKGINTPDDFNVANTNVIAHGGRLLALWEGGSAHDLDPETLETRGPVTWRADLKGVPFSAHPKLEADGTLWNMGAAPNALVLYRIDRDGTLAHAQVVKIPGLVMNHDFAVSQRHLVCVLPAIRFSIEKARAGASFLDSIDFPAGVPMRVLVVDKNDLTKQRWYELPAGFLFHFGNAWDEDGVLHFDYVHHDDAGIMKDGLRALMRGDVGAMHETPAHSRHVSIDLARGTLRTRTLPDRVEFPRIDPRFVARRNRQLWQVASVPGVPVLFSSILRYDLDRETRDVFRYEEGCMAEEHILVPDRASGREGGGWLVGCVYDPNRRRTSVNVFDALSLAAGPIARAWLPYGIPPGFHGHFQPA